MLRRRQAAEQHVEGRDGNDWGTRDVQSWWNMLMEYWAFLKRFNAWGGGCESETGGAGESGGEFGLLHP